MPTRTGASGMLLQKLPGAEGSPARPRMRPQIDDAWRRVQLIGETLTPEELRTLADAEILHRLFNEDDVRLFEPSPVYFRCRCSRERVGGMLQGLGEAETRSVLAERGEVEVRCDFCNRAYVFDAVDVAQLFNARCRERQRQLGALTDRRRARDSRDRGAAVAGARALAGAVWPRPATAARRRRTPVLCEFLRASALRGGDDGDRPRTVLRSRLVGVRQDGLRDLP